MIGCVARRGGARGAQVITRADDCTAMSPRGKAKPPEPAPDPTQSPVRQAAERTHARVAAMEGGAVPITPKEAPTLLPLRADLKMRFGLTAWSNSHFDNALFPLGTPHDEYLPRYATVFSAAEADQLYHRLPGKKLLDPWVEQTPKDFRFLPKMWKKVTHEGGGVEEAKTWLALLEPLRAAGKLGPILVQLPPSMKREKGWDLVEKVLALQEPGSFALEVRNPTWFVDATQELLTTHDAALVWGTHPKAFAPPWATSSWGYVRFTGNLVDVRGRYVTQTDRLTDILEMRKRVQHAPWKEAYVISTNPFEGNAADSLPRIAAALGDGELAKRLTRKPGEVWFPGPPQPKKGQKQLTLG